MANETTHKTEMASMGNPKDLVTFCGRRDKKNFDPSDTYAINCEIPFAITDLESLDRAMKFAYNEFRGHRTGIKYGSARSGVYEVQCNAGIYNHENELTGGSPARIDVSTPRKAAKVVFKSWDQLEAE
jgi:hypothetical protein